MKTRKILSRFLLFLTVGFFLGFYHPIQVNASDNPYFFFSLAKAGVGFPHKLDIAIGKPLDNAEVKQGELVDLIINFDSKGKKIGGKFKFVFYYDATKMSQTYCSEENFSKPNCAKEGGCECVDFDIQVQNYLKNWTKKLEKLPDGRAKVTMEFELTDKLEFPRYLSGDKIHGSYFFLTIQGMQIKNDAKGDLPFTWDRDKSLMPVTNPPIGTQDKTYAINTEGKITPPIGQLEKPSLECTVTSSGVNWSWTPVTGGVNYLLYVYSITTGANEEPLGSEGKWFTTTKEAIAGKTPDIKYQGHLTAYDKDKNEQSKSDTATKGCKIPSKEEPVIPPVTTITTTSTKATLKFGVRMPDISVDSVETVLVKISDFADQKKTLTKKEKDYFIGDLAFENLSDKKTFSIYVKKENVTIGRKFSSITLKPEENLDCATYNTNTNCGTLLDQQEAFYSENNDKILFSGDANDDSKVDRDDFTELVGFYNKIKQPANFNLDAEGKTDREDFTILVKNYNKSGDIW